MHHVLRSLVLIPFAALALVACGGYSPEEAQTKCDLERTSKSQCVNDAAYQQCLSCFEECGDGCAIAESCPLQYICTE